MFQINHSPPNGVGGAVVANTGNKVVNLLNDLGLIKKAAYYSEVCRKN